MKTSSFFNRFLGIIGNFLEHYDLALFGLLAPFIAPLFFVETDSHLALLLTYAMLPLGFLTKPLGALFFGWIGDRYGRKHALFYSLLGMAFISIGIGCLPVYADIGIYAPCFLALGRMLQSFFAAGESTGGAIFVLEHTSETKRTLISSFYDATSVAGILFASGLITWMSSQNLIQDYWRILYWFGGITGVIGVFFRLFSQEVPAFVNASTVETQSWIKKLITHKKTLISIILASGYSHTTYAMGFTLMNGYVPMITMISKTETMEVNTLLLVVDMLLLPFFGYLAHKYGKERLMLSAALCSAITALPAFLLLSHASMSGLILIRLVLILPGIAFAAPYYAWKLEKVPIKDRYLVLAFGGAIGSKLIGASSSSICLGLYYLTKWNGAPGLYLTLIGIAASWAISPIFHAYLPIKLKKST